VIERDIDATTADTIAMGMRWWKPLKKRQQRLVEHRCGNGCCR